MKCHNCGNEISNDDVFCSKCGTRLDVGNVQKDMLPIDGRYGYTQTHERCWGSNATMTPGQLGSSQGQEHDSSQDTKARVVGLYAKDDSEKEEASIKGSNVMNTNEIPVLFKRFLNFYCLSIILSVLGSCFGDVRDYYDIGKHTYFWTEVAGTILDIWLFFALKAQKSWARKMFIVASFLSVLVLSIDGSPSYIAFLTLTGLIDLYCLILLFDNEVKAVFLPDSKATGVQATVNRYQVAFFLICICVLIVVYGGVSFYRITSSIQWVEDCTAAARMGSIQAEKNLREEANRSDEIGEECRKALSSLSDYINIDDNK